MSLNGIDAGELTRMVMALRREDGDLILEDLIAEDLDIEALANLWLYLSEWKSAAALLEKIVNDALSAQMEQRGHGLEVGDWIVFYSTKKTEKCVDTAGFHEALRSEIVSDLEIVERLVNPNSIRIGSLPPEIRSKWFKKEEHPKAEKSLAAAPVEKVEEARIRKERTQ